MRRSIPCCVIGALMAVGFGFGRPPEAPTRRTVEKTADPTPTRPATGAWGRSFDAESNFPDWKLTLVRTSWVQLDHREQEDASIVVGFEPSPGLTLDQALSDHQRQYGGPGGGPQSESGSMESAVLGRVVWSRTTLDLDGAPVAELVLFADHPASGPLLVGRFDYPSGTVSADADLDELVRAAEIIGPGL